jgi:hypothetical protein
MRKNEKNKNKDHGFLCWVMPLIAGITGIGPTLASPRVSP